MITIYLYNLIGRQNYRMWASNEVELIIMLLSHYLNLLYSKLEFSDNIRV